MKCPDFSKPVDEQIVVVDTDDAPAERPAGLVCAAGCGRYGYPPDQQEAATLLIIEQAEFLAEITVNS